MALRLEDALSLDKVGEDVIPSLRAIQAITASLRSSSALSPGAFSALDLLDRTLDYLLILGWDDDEYKVQDNEELVERLSRAHLVLGGFSKRQKHGQVAIPPGVRSAVIEELVAGIAPAFVQADPERKVEIVEATSDLITKYAGTTPSVEVVQAALDAHGEPQAYYAALRALLLEVGLPAAEDPDSFERLLSKHRHAPSE